MEAIEEKFRRTPKEHPKYAKRLTDYINKLIEKGRLLEAKHFFDILYKDKGNNSTTIRLGYFLAIKLFDPKEVKIFDSLLFESHPAQTELQTFQLKFYHSMNNYAAAERCCEYLLSQRLNNEQLTTIVEICINRQNYAIATNLIDYLNKKKISLSESAKREIRIILIRRLIDVIILRAKNG
ncbi:MAG: hypothetical protein PHI11_05820 [Gallionella sp.]|nr:hypothetical protein [Gallionella sp.]